MKNMKIAVSGFLVGAVFFGGVSYAAEKVKLDAYLGVKLFQNGIDKTPADQDQKPIVANGVTYVPLKVVAGLVGVDVAWDKEKYAVILGEKIDGKALGVPAEFIAGEDDSIGQNQPMTINKTSYGHNKGMQVYSYDYSGDEPQVLRYNLNGQYSELVLSLGMDDRSDSGATRTVKFIDQDNKVLAQQVIGIGTLEEALKVNVKGVVQLKIEIGRQEGHSQGAYIDFINPLLIK
ncbi:NPCBM/NEW2 domain-containing protein [Paenibacillus spongiae]|uniref:NPCBM/NEW2 domain-containing protein n=1 Tax=Paenibacillus spongiae TaxID=2909671 RepID=A0ABY5SIT6_9BACL|nr:NPCBM/NEW2 domain-containing protein [Paenibacillus spongiae]UVI33554.1 NPCBM/NEW2 domain-containing protein [Paenibacillus spongiae]